MLRRDIAQKLFFRNILNKRCSTVGNSLCQPRDIDEVLGDKVTVGGPGLAVARK